MHSINTVLTSNTTLACLLMESVQSLKDKTILDEMNSPYLNTQSGHDGYSECGFFQWEPLKLLVAAKPLL